MLHEQQKEPDFCYAARALVMRKRHEESLKKPVMLEHASQTSRPMQNVHDRSQNPPDPDIFAIDTYDSGATGPTFSTLIWFASQYAITEFWMARSGLKVDESILCVFYRDRHRLL